MMGRLGGDGGLTMSGSRMRGLTQARTGSVVSVIKNGPATVSSFGMHDAGRFFSFFFFFIS